MNKIAFVRLSDVSENEIISLMNNDLVGKHLPLLSGEFSVEDCNDFLKDKSQLWEQYGFGPWAFLINSEFAGWGGLQPENGEADFALVLHPKFWGWGPAIFNKVKDHAFNVMKVDSITILLPPDRPNSKAVKRIGFIEDNELIIDGQSFMRFRLHKDAA